MTNVFNVQVLAEKLTGLNNSQQSIETLSHWCIFHRKKAKQVVETWEKLFNSSPKEKKVPFLYLANDILQNSRRKGNEFVNEYWKVLPNVLKGVVEGGDDHEKNIALRLVNIWDERKVFGSRGRALKDEMLGKEPPPLLESNGKSPQPIKIVKKDAHAIRIKLTVGCMPEKIITAFQSVHDDNGDEEVVLNNCKSAVQIMGKLQKNVDETGAQGDLDGSQLATELDEQETVLKRCVQQLEAFEASRNSLVLQLKEALQEEESKMEVICMQLQVARSEVTHAASLKQKLSSLSLSTNPISRVIPPSAEMGTVSDINQANLVTTTLMQQAQQPRTSSVSSLTAEEQHKKAAAEVAAKLAAMTSSAQMLTSVFSSLAAEAAASMNGSLPTGSFSATTPVFSGEKRPKLDRQIQIPDQGNSYTGQMTQQSLTSIPLMASQAPVSNLSTLTPTNPPQPLFPPLPPVPPPPLPPGQQYMQSSGGMVGVMPFVYGGNTLPPPPLPPPHVLMGLGRPNTPSTPQQQQSPAQGKQPQLPQLPITSGAYQSGVGFYSQSGSTTSTTPQGIQR